MQGCNQGFAWGGECTELPRYFGIFLIFLNILRSHQADLAPSRGGGRGGSSVRTQRTPLPTITIMIIIFCNFIF